MSLKSSDGIMTIITNEEVVIMVTLEQVEKLRERTGISYEEAKRVLEESNGDLLEAVIKLEQQNRIQAPESGGYYHSKGEARKTEHTGDERTQETKAKTASGASFGDMVESFFRWCGKVIHTGNINNFNVIKDDKAIMVVPLTLFAVLLIFAFWIVLPIVVIGLIFGYRYRFSGPDLDKTQANRAMDAVSEVTLSVCDAVGSAVTNIKKNNERSKGEQSDGENPNH